MLVFHKSFVTFPPRADGSADDPQRPAADSAEPGECVAIKPAAGRGAFDTGRVAWTSVSMRQDVTPFQIHVVGVVVSCPAVASAGPSGVAAEVDRTVG